ncbi:MAG: polyhydroxyalkanoate depolymerase [Alphaproteobacteria bacterium]|nr:polyhydroxyalkanoate depolymerase [Alphaproteobacteria bacterium]
MQYHAYELAHAWISPMRAATQGMKLALDLPFNPWGKTLWGRHTAAACDVFEGLTRRYGKPAFGLEMTPIEGELIPVTESVVLSKPFCNLLHFERAADRKNDPRVLIVAPLSGHYATLLRDTVRAMLPEHDVYITDWRDARSVPVYDGDFDLDDYVDYVRDFIGFLGADTHVIAVCQPAVPALIATALMAADDDPCQPASLTLMGGPIDTRRSPTVVNRHAESKDMHWFEQMVISTVPWPNPGAMRKVYPGFVQLSGFLSMNLERHITAHHRYFDHLVEGDCDPVDQHKKFYEEYLSVMDLPAEFFLQTVKTVFKEHHLPKGLMQHRGEPVDLTAITKTALMTVEGEKDDICAVGQTAAAHDLCTNVPDDRRFHYVQPGVGHYGVFNGTRWRTEIQPRIRDMIRSV